MEADTTGLKSSRISKVNDFSPLFYPKSIAIIGLSKNPMGGLKYYMALQTSGYIKNGGKVFPINPKYDQINGIKIFRSIDDEEIPKPIDLAIIAVPAKLVPMVVRGCQNKAKFAVIYSSGFAESGNNELDKSLREAIAAGNTRFIGPNCLGVLNPYSRLSIYPNWTMFKGNISYVSQSGGTMARLYMYLGSSGIGFHNVVSIGNSYDLTVLDLLEHFKNDELTKTIGFYLESIPDGRKFMELAREITPKKPIVLFKGGQTTRGNNATFSHTGGLAGTYEVWEAMCRQTGIMLADHFEFFADLMQVASIRPVTPKNLNVCVLVAGGGIGVEFTDIFIKSGLNVPDLQPETIKTLEEVFPAVNTNFQNPIDLGEYGYDPQRFAKALEVVSNDPNIGNVVFVREPERFPIISSLLGIEDAEKATIETLAPIVKNAKIPIFCNPSMNRDNEKAYVQRKNFQDKMIEAGIPVINYFINSARIIKQLYFYGRFLDSQNSKI